MKKIMIIAALLVGANLSYGQVAPLTFKTSAGSATGSVAGAATTTIYVDVTNLGALSVTGSVALATGTSYKSVNCNVIPVVSNDGTNFSVIRSTNGTWALTAYTAAAVDTVLRGATLDTAAILPYKFPIGYRYVGFKCVGASGGTVSFSAKGLSK